MEFGLSDFSDFYEPTASSSQNSLTGSCGSCSDSELCVCRTPSIGLSGSERRERKVRTHCGQELACASYSGHQLEKTGRICLVKESV